MASVSTTTPSLPTTISPDSTVARRRVLVAALLAAGMVVLAASAAAVIFAPDAAKHPAAPGSGHTHAAARAAVAPQPVGAVQVQRIPGVGEVRLSAAAVAPAGAPLRSVPAGAPLRLRFTVPAGAGDALPKLRASVLPSIVAAHAGAGHAGATAGLQPVSVQREATVLVDRRRGQVAVPNQPGAHGAHQPGQGLAQTMPSGGYSAAAKVSAGATATAVDPGGRFLALAVADKGRIEVVDLLSGRMTGSVATAGRPSDLAFAPDGRLWVSDSTRGRVSVVDPARLSVVRTLATGTATGRVAFGPAGRRAVAAGPDGVALLDGRALRVIATAPVAAPSVGAGWSAAAGAFAIGGEDGTVTLLPPTGRRGKLERIDLRAEGRVRAFAVAPGGQHAVAATGGDGALTIVDLARNETMGPIAAGKDPAQIGFLGHFALVRNAGSADLTWVDLRSPSRSNSIPLGPKPATSLAIAPDGRRALLASPADQKVLGLHVMMGRPMLMQADPNTARADAVLVSGGGLQRTGARTFELRTSLQQAGDHRLELRLAGGGRATFRLPVTAPRASDATVHAARTSYRAAVGETVTVGFHVSGAAPRDAQVLAFSIGTLATQARAEARQVAPGYYEARLRIAEPGTYRVQLESEEANLGTRAGQKSTLRVIQ